jgi:hypothetical protein
MTAGGGRGRGRRGRSSARRRELAGELAGRLEQLDDDLNTVLERFRLRERGRLQALLEAARGDGGTFPTQAKARRMLELLEDLRLKPERGRTRDLAAIHSVLKKLESLWREG